MKSSLVNLTLLIVAETDNAVAVRLDENSPRVWLAKVLVDFDPPTLMPAPAEVALPQWLAVKEGLV